MKMNKCKLFYRWMVGTFALLLVVGVAGLEAQASDSCVAATGGKCLCESGKHQEGCSCENCSGGADCACVAALKAKTGTVTGQVINKRVSKYPTLVYVENIEGKHFDPPKQAPVMDQKIKEFLPHVLPVLVGTTVEFLNSDSFDHNVFTPDGEKYDLGKWGQGQKKDYTFKETGVFVQLCRIHPEMVGYVVSLQNPYYTFTDDTGKFSLGGLPPGSWKLKVWNERFKPKQIKQAFEVTVEAGKETSADLAL